jgi:hypothetical protein
MSQLKEIVSGDIKRAVIEINRDAHAYSALFMTIFVMIVAAIVEVVTGDAGVFFGALVGLVIIPLGLMLIAYIFNVLIKLIGVPKQ